MRPFTACAACRTRRRRCEVSLGKVACDYCIEHDIQCTRIVLAPTSQQPRRTKHSLIPSPQNSGSSLPPQPLCLELVTLYFDYIHDQFHSLFHRTSFMQDVVEGRAYPVILYAMMALSARFSNHPALADASPWNRGNAFAKESALLLDLTDISLKTVQACVLLGVASRSEGEGGAESVYYSVACRIANLLDLANMPTKDALQRELNSRVWWSLSKIDTWSSAGVGLPRQMVHFENVPLPMDEASFLSMTRHGEAPPDPETSRRTSLVAQMFLLNLILQDVHDFHAQLVWNDMAGDTIRSSVHKLASRLDEWHDSLPRFMEDTPSNLKRFAEQGYGRIFVAVHLGYYHFGQLLFYSFLHEDTMATNPNYALHEFATKCKHYAADLCRLVYESSEVDNCKVLYTMVGQNIVIASTVQIHTLLYGTDDAEIFAARQRLERNFAILTEMRTYWPVLEVSFASFRTFREACRKNMDTAFRMDGWMLKFLYGITRPVEDKESFEAAKKGAWLGENIGLSPRDWE